MVTVTHFKSGDMIDGAAFIAKNVYPTTIYANDIRMNVLKNWANALVLADTTDPVEIKRITEEMAANTKVISSNFDKLNELESSDNEKKLVEETLAARKTYLDNRKHYVELIKSGSAEEARQYLVDVLRQDINNYVDRIGKLVVLQSDKMESQTNQVYDYATSLKFVNMLLGGIVVLFAAATTFNVISTVKHQLGGEIQYVVEIARQIAAGNLKVTIEVQASDKQSLMLSMLAMRDKLREIVGDIEQNAHLASLSSQRLVSTAEEVAHASHAQSEAAATTATAVEEMTACISEISRSAENAQEISRHTESVCENGAAVIQRAATSMSEIALSVKTSAEVIAELEQHSKEVFAVVNVIQAIAEQTNLLALNAAIEAARAGEQGRGFAVVADEVRNLSERTRGSTLEIAGTIEKIQTATKNAVLSMGSGVEKVGHGAVLAEQAGSAIYDIKSSTANVVQRIDQITVAIKEQSLSCNEIACNVERIAQMTGENSRSVDKTSQAAHQLEIIAASLEKSIGYFRI